MKKRSVKLCGILTGCVLLSTLTGCGAENASLSILTEQSVGTEQSSPAETFRTTELLSLSQEEKGVVSFSYKSGFYDKEISLELKCSVDGAKIYYTTDGSEPNKSKTLYTGAIKLKNATSKANVLSAVKGISAGGDYIPKQNVDKANVIRAVAYLPDGSKTDIVCGTYFIGIDRQKKYGNVPVISLVTDTKNLFDSKTGIYVLGDEYTKWLSEDEDNAKVEAWQAVGNYSQKGKKWERPVTMEYFDSSGSSRIVQDMGIRIMGAASRNSTQKSFRLTAREEYGQKSVKYQIIPDNLRSDGKGNVTKYKSFILRNGGNDCDYAKIRDPFWQELASDRSFETQQYTPCVVFLDGEYWGMYTLAEDYSDNYIENNYGIDNNSVVVLKKGEIEDGEKNDISLYNDMYDFITQKDMSVSANYKKAAGMLDMQSFADYCAFNLYIYNEDSIFKDNNWEMWRERNGGIWRMMVYDTDYSSGIYSGGANYRDNNLSQLFGELKKEAEQSDYRHPALIFFSLYENDDFKEKFVNALCDMRNINFEKFAALERLNDISQVYSRLVPDTFERFGPEWIANWDAEGYYSQKINELAVFVDGRYDVFPDLMEDALELKSQAVISLSSDEGGGVIVNSSGRVIDGDFKGIYFTDYPVVLKAVADEGKRFAGWEVKGCTVSDKTAEQITVKFSGDFSVKAKFEDDSQQD